MAAVKKREQDKKLSVPKPEQFNRLRASNPTYRQWYKTVNGYLRYHKGSWEGEHDLTTIVGIFMKGKARDWFDSLAQSTRQSRKIDTFRAFASKMDERFKADKEEDISFEELKKVKYENDILSYIDKLELLNIKVGLQGLVWRKVIKAGLPEVLLDRLSPSMGGEPQEDDALIACIKEHGLSLERRNEEKNFRATREVATLGRVVRGSGSEVLERTMLRRIPETPLPPRSDSKRVKVQLQVREKRVVTGPDLPETRKKRR